MTSLSLPLWDAARLATALREHNLPGQRSKTAITRLRRERNRHRPAAVPPPTVVERLHAHLIGRYTAEIRRRGGETEIPGDRSDTFLRVADRHDGLVLLHAEGWRYYSRRHGFHRASLSYVCGREDGQLWAVRVPGTITTVAEALDWITPKAVKDARAAGRQVWRQGDVYAVQTSKQYDGRGDLPDNHVWDKDARTLTHPEHGTLLLPGPVRFVPQNAYMMGRGGSRAYAD
ncbi:hypothetical protein ACWCSD_31910 [Nonomuraea sp. NPDC001684]